MKQMNNNCGFRFIAGQKHTANSGLTQPYLVTLSTNCRPVTDMCCHNNEKMWWLQNAKNVKGPMWRESMEV